MYVNFDIKMNLFVLLSIVTTFCLEPKHVPLRFDNFQVYRVTPRTLEQLEILKKLEKNPQGYHFWTGVSTIGHTVDIMVPSYLKYNFHDLLAFQKLETNLWIDNVQKLIDDEGSQVSISPEEFNWKNYYTLDSVSCTSSFQNSI